MAQTSKHILVFAFDPLSLNSISFISYIALYCSYLIHAWYCLCAYTYVESRELHIAPPTLNLEESRGDSPEPFTGILATLFGYTCVVIKF